MPRLAGGRYSQPDSLGDRSDALPDCQSPVATCYVYYSGRRIDSETLKQRLLSVCLSHFFSNVNAVVRHDSAGALPVNAASVRFGLSVFRPL